MADENANLNKIILTSLEDILKEAEQGEFPDEKRRKVGGKERKRQATGSIQNDEYKWYCADEKKFYNGLTEDDKRFIASMEGKVKLLNKESIPIRFKILMSNIDDKIKAVAIKKLGYLYNMDESTGEFYKTSNWIEALCKLPIGRYKTLPVNNTSPIEEIRTFIKKTKTKLDNTVYGHNDAKDQIIRFLAQRITKSNAVGNNIIGLEGPPGVGKTLIAKEGISKALDLPFQFISLSGTEDASHMVGHSYTYEGSTWGKIADMLMKSGCMNLVIFMDELDKVSASHKGEEISNLLIHLTDSTQNDKFQDKYFMDVDLDLSKCLIIFSYNDANLINPILRDRMIKIKADGYNLTDKVQIAQKYLIRDLCQQFDMTRDNIVISDEVLKYIILNKIEEEKGVRNLKRALELIMSNINLNLLLEEENIPFPFEISVKTVDTYVKHPDNTLQKYHAMYT